MTGPASSLPEIASAGRLLVISDYDGVIAPIVANPAAAHPDPAVKAALLQVAELRRTYVAVVSGRELRSVVELFGAAPGVTMIGSHGAESDEPVVLSSEQGALLERAIDELRTIAADHEGALVEAKPTSVALHVRTAESGTGPRLVEAVRRGPSTWPGVRTVEGKQVIELLVLATDKGDAVDALRRRFAPDRVVVLGDDVTDEDAFAALDDVDLGIKVGPGDSIAGARIESQQGVAELLAELADARRRAVESETGAANRAGNLE